MYIKKIFPTLIYKIKYDGDLEKIKNNIIPKFSEIFNITKYDNQGSMRGNGLCSYNVKRDLYLWDDLKEIKEFIEKNSQLYWESLGYRTDQIPSIAEMWINSYLKDSFIDLHNHSPQLLTASFYLSKPKNSGNIIFENPMSDILKYQPYERMINRSLYHKLFEEEVETNEGDLIIFPGYLKHKTNPNLSDGERIIIGANIN